MDDISNRTLALLLVGAIVVSLATTIYSLNIIDKFKGIPLTGRATTDAGNVSVNILSTISIVLKSDTINFGSGYVNDTNPACNNATLNAGQTYNDTNDPDTITGTSPYCWTNYSAKPTSLDLENDGNVNVSIDVTGPNATVFFHFLPSTTPMYNFTWRARQNESSSCESGLQTSYREFNHTSPIRVCDRLQNQGVSDTIAIDVQLIIPSSGLTPGVYENASIVFTAAQN